MRERRRTNPTEGEREMEPITVRRSRGGSSRRFLPGRDDSLAGDWATFGAVAILALLETERKTGRLVVWRPGETARMLFRGGRIVSSEIARRGSELRGTLPCVLAILGWTNGRFRFGPCEVQAHDAAGERPTGVLLECARRLDEARTA